MQFSVFIDQESNIHTRKSYNLLDLIGDLGGVLEIVITLFGIFLCPVAEHSFILKALQKLYLARTKQDDMLLKKHKKTKKREMPRELGANHRLKKEVEIHRPIAISTWASIK